MSPVASPASPLHERVGPRPKPAQMPQPGMPPQGLREAWDAAQPIAERWRERLIDGGDEVLGELVESYPTADRHRLRQLIRQAGIERRENRAPSAQPSLRRAGSASPPSVWSTCLRSMNFM